MNSWPCILDSAAFTEHKRLALAGEIMTRHDAEGATAPETLRQKDRDSY